MSKGGKHATGGFKAADGSIIPSTKFRPVLGDEDSTTVTAAFALLYGNHPDAAHVWWGGNHYPASAGLPNASRWLVWDKQNGPNDFADCELAWTNARGPVRMLSHMWNGMMRASERGKRVHPNQKPVALIVWALNLIDPDKRDGWVFDGFGGSGSTLLAAEQTGRRAALIELDPGYCDVICRRYQEATGTMPVRESDGEQVDFTGGDDE